MMPLSFVRSADARWRGRVRGVDLTQVRRIAPFDRECDAVSPSIGALAWKLLEAGVGW